MSFDALIKIMKSQGIISLADIARELHVSPQSVSNWKSRNKVPYKYSRYIKNKYGASILKTNNEKLINDEGINFFELVNILYNRKKNIAIIALIFGLIGIIYSLNVTPLYKSSISMYSAISESKSQFSQFQGVASTLGLNVGQTSSNYNIPDIIKSYKLKSKIIYNKWETEKYSDFKNLIDYWELKTNNSIFKYINPINIIRLLSKKDFSINQADLIYESNAIVQLSNRILIDERKTGLIVISIFMEEAKLASDIANFLYPSIVDITIAKHAQESKLNRTFIEERQNEVKNQLIISEDKLKEFRNQNQSIGMSPQLQLELERLSRDVEIKTQVYITLQNQYELARIEEVKKTPSVVVLDDAKPAVERYSPKRKLIVLLSVLIGGILASVTIIIKELLKKDNI